MVYVTLTEASARLGVPVKTLRRLTQVAGTPVFIDACNRRRRLYVFDQIVDALAHRVTPAAPVETKAA